MKTHFLIPFLIYFCCMLLQTLCNAQIYEYSYTPPASVDPDGSARYKIYIPESVDTVRGIYCYLSGWQWSSLDQVDNVVYKEYVEEKGFALMGFHMQGLYTDYYDRISLWSGEALIDALKELSVLSGHPELAYSAMLFDGASAGGQFSYHFAMWRPERVIAFITVKGGYHSLSPAGDAINVPGYLFVGENDNDYRIENLTTIFETNRPNGALWALAIELNTGHEKTSDAEVIIHSFFDEIIPMRVPETIPLDDFPELKEIAEESGWLGNRTTFEVRPYDEYQGNKGMASWFPNEKIAREWQEFVVEEITATSIDTSSLNIYPIPTENAVYIQNFSANADISYQLSDISGKIVDRGKLRSEKIDLADMDPGVYILHLKVNNKMICKKIVIQ